MDNRTKGNIGEASAILYFTLNGYTVSLPISENNKYDMIVEKDGILKKVQCKYSSAIDVNGSYSIHMYNCGGNRSAGNYKRYYSGGDFDLLYVHLGNGNKYLIPYDIVKSNRTITLGKDNKWARWESYRV